MPIKQIENNEVSEKFVSNYQKKVLADAENSDILKALISGPRETITIDVGGIPVEIYEPDPRQLFPLQRITMEVRKYQATSKKGLTDQDTEMVLDAVVQGFGSLEELCEQQDRLLADLTVDPALSYEAFASGLISNSKKAQILSGIQKWSINRIKTAEEKEKVATFRDKPKRARPSGSPPSDGMDIRTVPGDARD